MTLLQQYEQNSKEGIVFPSLALQYVTENALGVSQLSLNPWQLKSVFPTLPLCPVTNRKRQKFL